MDEIIETTEIKNAHEKIAERTYDYLEKYTRKNRIAKALELRGMKQVDLCEKTGIKSSSMTSWIKQAWQPKQIAIFKMAKVLDVSEMWLAGYDVPMQRLDTSDEAENLCVEIKTNYAFRDLCKNIKSLPFEKYDLIRKLVDIFVENERISSENIEKEE